MELKNIERGHYYGGNNDYWMDTSYFVKEYIGQVDYQSLKIFVENSSSTLQEIHQKAILKYEDRKKEEYEEYKKIESNYVVKLNEYKKKSKFYQFFNLAPQINRFKSETSNKDVLYVEYYIEKLTNLNKLLEKYEENQGLFFYEDKNDTTNGKPYLVDNVIDLINKNKNEKKLKLKF